MACHLKPSQTFTDAQLKASCRAVSPLGTATAFGCSLQQTFGDLLLCSLSLPVVHRTRKSSVLFVWKVYCLKVYWEVFGSYLASYVGSRDAVGISCWDCLHLYSDPADQGRV